MTQTLVPTFVLNTPGDILLLPLEERVLLFLRGIVHDFVL